MRKLAADLGVNPMSLYHHVASKAALLDGLIELVADGARQVEVGPGTWQEQLQRLADEFRTLSLAHRNLIRYAFSTDDFIQRDGPMWRALCTILRSAGLAADEVPRVGAVLAAMVGGLVFTEVNGTMRRLVGGQPSVQSRAAAGWSDGDADDAGFQIAVRLLIDGVAARG